MSYYDGWGPFGMEEKRTWAVIRDPAQPQRIMRAALYENEQVRWVAWFSGHASQPVAPSSERAPVREGPNTLRAGANAPCAGVLIALAVAVGDRVVRGQRIGTVEAMKMEFAVVADADGLVGRLLAEVGKPLARGAAVAEVIASCQAHDAGPGP